jgi:protein-S-isoprenylcysteine O-methyltransferase Ste14
MTNLFKSLLHNIGVAIMGFVIAFVGTRADALLGIPGFASVPATVIGGLLLILGFLLRVWATFCFYEQRMSVISLAPQAVLLTSGPYRFSRNPLYLGGNVFIFFGAALALDSTVAFLFTALHLLLIDRFIRREEWQLAAQFGEAWARYRNQVRRWI